MKIRNYGIRLRSSRSGGFEWIALKLRMLREHVSLNMVQVTFSFRSNSRDIRIFERKYNINISKIMKVNGNSRNFFLKQHLQFTKTVTCIDFRQIFEVLELPIQGWFIFFFFFFSKMSLKLELHEKVSKNSSFSKICICQAITGHFLA